MAIYKTNVSDKLEGALNQKENIWEDIRTLARHKNIGETSTGIEVVQQTISQAQYTQNETQIGSGD